ncbi:hypothetical protein L6E_03160 [Enterococcus hirae]|nr:hypothetical protein L6E_03160 [Enterococcus hirae]GMB99447.1 hypothetical protein K2D_25190 [Enterococcus hirae]GMC05462.1 hypothetical protein K4F_04650 [Enterococcus hirae]
MKTFQKVILGLLTAVVIVIGNFLLSLFMVILQRVEQTMYQK